MDKYGVQELNSKGLIDTVEEIKNKGPGSLLKDLSPQLQRINLSFTRKTRTKQNPNTNVAAATEYMRIRSWMTPLEMPLWAPRLYTGERPKRLFHGSLTDSGYSLVLMIPVDSERIWASNQCHWKLLEIIFPSI